MKSRFSLVSLLLLCFLWSQFTAANTICLNAAAPVDQIRDKMSRQLQWFPWMGVAVGASFATWIFMPIGPLLTSGLLMSEGIGVAKYLKLRKLKRTIQGSQIYIEGLSPTQLNCIDQTKIIAGKRISEQITVIRLNTKGNLKLWDHRIRQKLVKKFTKLVKADSQEEADVIYMAILLNSSGFWSDLKDVPSKKKLRKLLFKRLEYEQSFDKFID